MAPRRSRNKIADAAKQVTRAGLSAAPDRIVEELSFGFWVSLLGSGNNYDQHLWRPALYRAFPGWRGRRRDLHLKLDYLRVLRNKIAHHAPIHHRHLTVDHDRVLECLGYVDAGLARWSAQSSNGGLSRP
ncbi:hypothetical protein Acor_08950 [Acrocarpospora corrugata]|uniref:Abi-like protein n=1 Tax=Acrocarpospora corrugata TaxID=35763 RepID=A0A5M3VT68_9ACTN|nr:hypothetical protein Acor_08950 [Acrocarpospora corrugata]